MVITVTLFSIAINVPSLWNQYTTIKKVEEVMIKYAQKNAGFMPIYDKYGSVVMTADQKINELMTIYDLHDKIKNIKFVPGLNIPVQKRDKFEIIITPRIVIKIPFTGDKEFSAKPIRNYGYSHKYFKN
jgi:hypothetical protein